MTNNGLVKPENVEKLRQLLCPDRNKRIFGVAKEAYEMSADFFDKVVGAAGDEKEIKNAIWRTTGGLSSMTLADSTLVANIVLAPMLAYPTKKIQILDFFLEYSNYFLCSGEGLAIGLLETANFKYDIQFEAALFEAFGYGRALSTFTSSVVTLGGLGRLTDAINKFVVPIWVKDSLNGRVKRGQVSKLLIRWHEVLFAHSMAIEKPNEFLDRFWNFSPNGKECFLEKFALELSARFFISAPLGIRFHLNLLLDKNLPKELVS